RPNLARRLTNVLTVIKTHCSTATEDTLSASLRQVSTPDELHECLQRWIEKVDRLPKPPFPGSDHLKPLQSAGEMIECGRQFENCLRSQIQSVIDGECYFYVWKRGRQLAVVKVQHAMVDGWA